MAEIPPEIRQQIRRAREKWRDLAHLRPTNIDTPGPGQESVWDYPRPPRVEAVAKRVRVDFGGLTIADTTAAYRVLETASPPTYYIPPGDIQRQYLKPSSHVSLCEWKGPARYFSPSVEHRVAANAAWCYPDPWSGFEAIRDYIAFMPGPMDACYVGDDRVTPQPGGFYGGWITPDVVGPFKGGPGTGHW